MSISQRGAAPHHCFKPIIENKNNKIFVKSTFFDFPCTLFGKKIVSSSTFPADSTPDDDRSLHLLWGSLTLTKDIVSVLLFQLIPPQMMTDLYTSCGAPLKKLARSINLLSTFQKRDSLTRFSPPFFS